MGAFFYNEKMYMFGWDNSLLNTVFYSFELSLLVELIQLVTKVGSFDVDDIILNTIGGAIGYIVYKVVRGWWYRK